MTPTAPHGGYCCYFHPITWLAYHHRVQLPVEWVRWLINRFGPDPEIVFLMAARRRLKRRAIYFP